MFVVACAAVGKEATPAAAPNCFRLHVDPTLGATIEQVLVRLEVAAVLLQERDAPSDGR